MPNQLYTVTPQPIDTILTWVKSEEIAIPEIQRPFVWENSKVRDLLDSLYKGYPVGYLITWRNPNAKLKDGTISVGKRILIDGQQRVTSLMAALLGQVIINKDYESTRIKIAFHPMEEKFEVLNAAVAKDKAWVPDIAALFESSAKMNSVAKTYAEANGGIDQDEVFDRLDQLKKIVNNQLGIIELNEQLDVEIVAEIFHLVNSQGAQLSQADFAMSKIAVNETYGGNSLRKAIDYFCHIAVSPEFYSTIKEKDKEFSDSSFMKKMAWMSKFNDDFYDPTYTDMLRVAFTSQMERGELKTLVALLSGRNFETKTYEEEIAEKSFGQLKTGIESFINETNFKRLVMILKSAGFISNSMVTSQNVKNFAFIIYLMGKADGIPSGELESCVRRWFVLTVLTGRYSGSPETRFDQDIRQIKDQGLPNFVKTNCDAQLSPEFWSALLPNNMNVSAARSPYWNVFQAAQIISDTKGFLSQKITCRELIGIKGDVHHLYPKEYLKSRGYARGSFNQIANLAITQQEINIAISAKSPQQYFSELRAQCEGGQALYGSIREIDVMEANLESHAIPAIMLEGELPFEDFLGKRRLLMSQIIHEYFDGLEGEMTVKE